MTGVPTGSPNGWESTATAQARRAVLEVEVVVAAGVPPAGAADRVLPQVARVPGFSDVAIRRVTAESPSPPPCG
jgi:hypothetical protein